MDEEESHQVIDVPKKGRNEFSFTRAELLHQMLMESFDFLSAARTTMRSYEAPTFNYADVATAEQFRKASLAYPNGLVEFDHFTHRTPSRIFANLNMNPDVRSLKFPARITIWPPLHIWAHWLLHTNLFAAIMVVVIVCNSITVAYDQELGNDEANQKRRRILEAMDFFFLCLFVAEIFLKFIDDFKGFWREGWDKFDFLITSLSLVAPILDLMYPEQEQENLDQVLTAVKYLRIIRIFRSLNVVTRIHGIQVIWGAVLKTFTAMVYIVLLMSIFFYIFAIVGVQYFERVTRTHVPNLRYRDGFKTLPNAVITLFQMFTIDQWLDLIKDLAKIEGYAKSCVYCLTWILLGAFIFNNIFVGVMVNNFQNIRQSLVEGEEADKAAKTHKVNLFLLDELENEGNLSDDVLVDWEAEIFHSMELIKALDTHMSPVFWPRDTMFQYYMLLEAYASNLDEREHILHLLDRAVLNLLDP